MPGRRFRPRRCEQRSRISARDPCSSSQDRKDTLPSRDPIKSVHPHLRRRAGGLVLIARKPEVALLNPSLLNRSTSSYRNIQLPVHRKVSRFCLIRLTRKTCVFPLEHRSWNF
jgi:hypothetical protein